MSNAEIKTWPFMSQEIIWEPIACIQCGNEFELSNVDRSKLAARGFDLPKRCPDCRRNKSRDIAEELPRRRRTRKKQYHQKYDPD